MKSTVQVGVETKTSTMQTAIFIVSILIVALIAYIDFLVSQEISIYIYYALPIALCSWFVSRRAGIIAAVASALAWYLVDIHDEPYHQAIHGWNIFVRLTFFISMAVILSKLKSALEKEKELASQDSLTGLSNRRAFFEIADAELKRARRYGRPLTLAYLDLDKFKEVNDQQGHQEGDRLLKAMADALRNCTRVTDAVARIGGDEFVVLLPETGEEAAFAAVQKIHQEVLQTMRENQWQVTLSIGALTHLELPDDVDEMVRNADHLMYTAKESGKNSIKFKIVDKKTKESLSSAENSYSTPA
jgi:diguanylate cyclase (GGDEF)-like protein